MTRTFPRTFSLPLFIALGVVVAVLAFSATRWVTDRTTDALPSLDLPVDAAAGRPGALNAQALFATRAPATVMIDANIGEQALTGAGVVVSTDGTIVTASHVVHDYETQQDADQIVVSFTDDGQGVRQELQARVVARDRYNDLAILKVDPSQSSFRLVAAKLATTDLPVGAEVAAIGYPLGAKWTQTTGIVSNVHRNIPSRMNLSWNIPDAIQFDAAINPGSSGGPLFNARGEVVGIVQQISSPNAANTGVSYAISAQIVARALRLSATTADIPYAWTGLRTRTVTPQLARAVGVAATSGAMVQEASGPAAKAGLQTSGRTVAFMGESVQTGDVIVGLGGQKVTSSDELQRLTGLLDPHSRVQVQVVRDGQRVTLELQPDQAR